MTTRLLTKFSSHLNTIREAIDGTSDLRSNIKLYKKIYKYYKDLGVNFSGDNQSDYETVLDCLYEEIV